MHRQPFQIGDWEVCANTCTLFSLRGKADTKVTPKSMDVLMHLAKNQGEVVSSSELLDEFWPGTVSSDHAVHKVIAELRNALGDNAQKPRYIKTVPKRGYSLVARMVPNKQSPLHKSAATAIHPSNSTLLRVISTVGLIAFIGALLVWSEIDLALNENSEIRLAVLPFTQAGDIDSNHQFFVEGLTDSLVTGLAKLTELSVLNPGNDPTFSTANKSPSTIGQALGAEHLLGGSVQYNGNKARVTVQLVRAIDGVHEYSEQFDLQESDIFQVQDEIVSSVVTALSIHLNERQRSQMRDWGTTNALAYEQFMKGEFYNNQFNPKDFQLAIQHHQQAIKLDPNFVNAYVGVVTAANNYAVYSGVEKIAELSLLVNEMHRQVAQLDPEHEVLDSIRAVHLRMNGNDYRIQEASLRQEILSGTAPDFALAHYALFLIGARLYDEAQQLLDAAAEVDPFEISPDETWDYRVMVALPQDAIILRKQQLQERPNHTGMLGSVARNLVLTGAADEANGFMARQIRSDIEGISSNYTRVVTGALSGEFMTDPVALQAQYAMGANFYFNNGALAFMLGDVTTGIDFWRKLVPVQKRRLINNVHTSEIYYPSNVVTNPDYQHLLEELDFGISWQRTLMEGVLEMGQATGVRLSDAAKRAYENKEFLHHNTLWTDSQRASIDNLKMLARTQIRSAAE